MTENASMDQTPSEETGAAPEVPGSNDLQVVIAQRDDFKEKWMRTAADLENYRKRMQRELADLRKYESLSLLKGILPALDNLDRALQAAGGTPGTEELLAGLGMVVKQFETALSSVGATPINSVGQPFDPNLHEAITQMPSAEHPPMTVLQEVERGYTLSDRVVRPSKVIVSKAAE